MTTYTNVWGDDTIPPSEYSYAAVSLTANTTFEWPQLATSANLIAQLMEVTATDASSFVLTMPAANQVSTAMPTLMRNLGSATFTVSDSTGGVITTIASGVGKLIYITSNATAAGVWASLTYGTGSSSADASALAGYGTKATSATLSTKIAVTTKGSSWTVATTDRATLFVSTSGSITASLPAAATAATDFFVGMRNSGTGTLTIDPNGGETIDGEATLAIAPGESAYVVCSGTTWYTLGYGRSVQWQFTKLVKSVTAGGTITLTAAEANNKLLQFTGSPSDNIIIVVPDVVAVYYCQNTYSGANTLAIKTASGASVTTAALSKTIVYCDGVDVAQAQTTAAPAASLSGGTAGAILYQVALDTTGFSAVGTTGDIVVSGGTGAPTFTTSLTVAQGGSGRVTGTTAYSLIATGTTATGAQQTLANGATTEILVGGGASALPVWTAATGSGSPVRATSPSLTTPNLGTPSAGVLTNCTGTASGLTAGNVTTNANLTGAVTSVGNATSLGSFSSANLASALTDETGSGLAVFATSPVLTTPNLGTPSTLVGTNITGTAAGLTAGAATTATTATVANGVGSATTTGSVSGATAPVIGQALIATSSTGATWQNTPGGGDALTAQPLSQFAATTSLQLKGVISDETGSGLLVFATDPVLTTPNIGTPSAGTLTNCTGLPAAGVSGTALVSAAIGTTVQAYDADLTTWAGIVPGANVGTALAIAVGSAGAFVTFNGALGTPSSGTLTNCTGLPAAGVTGTAAILGANSFTAFISAQNAAVNSTCRFSNSSTPDCNRASCSFATALAIR